MAAAVIGGLATSSPVIQSENPRLRAMDASSRAPNSREDPAGEGDPPLCHEPTTPDYS